MLNKESAIHLSIILLVILVYLHPYLNVSTFPARGDAPNIKGVHTTDLTAILGIYPWEARKAVWEYGQFPFWSPWRFGGTPIFAKPQAVFFYINLPLVLLAPTIFAGIKWSILMHFFIAAFSMYALMCYLSKNNLVAFVSSFVYTLNGYMISRLNWGQTNIIYPYAWLPLILLFTFLAIENREWIFNSIIIGILFSFLVLSGGAQLFSYFAIIYFYFLLLYYILNFSKETILSLPIKYLKMGFIIAIVFFGMTSVFLLPNSDLIKISVRSQGYSYEQSLGGRLRVDTSFFIELMKPHFFKKPFGDWESAGLGLLPFLLLIPSLFYFKKRRVLLFILLAIITILIFQGSFLYYIFWKLIPQFRQVKGIYKGHALIYFMLSILAGYGFLYLINKTEKLKYRNLIRYSFIGLIVINLTFFNNTLTAQTNINYELSKNNILQHIAQDKDIFRFYMYETRGIDWGTDHYNVPLGLHDVFGTENVWIVDYLPIYLSQANANPAKLYGILNTKYITSKTPLNISGYRLIGEFEGCGYYPNGMEICQPRKSDGRYLYLNEGFLPRAYSAKKSILITGNPDSVKQISYYILQNPNYSPINTVVLLGEGKIDNYNTDFLKSIDLVLLTQDSFDANSGYTLQTYAQHGILMPNILAGETTYNQDRLNNILSNFSKNADYSNVDKLEISYYSPNKIVLETKNKTGFLVLSEIFSYYRNWRAFDDKGKEKPIYHANGVISAVLLEGEDKIIFQYIDHSFKMGLIISSITLIGIMAYFAYFGYKKSYNKKLKLGDSNQA